MAEWSNIPSKISACELIPIVYSQISSDEQQQLLELLESFAKYEVVSVRRIAAQVIGKMVSLVQRGQIKLNLIYLWKALSNDQADSVVVTALN